MTTSIHLDDADATRDFGRALGRALVESAATSWVIYFNGELGAGKTTLIGAMLAQFGNVGSAKSPTYTLIEPYELANRHFSHIDLYRLARPQDAEALALKDLLGADSILLIEWPERGKGFVPAADFDVTIEYSTAGGRDVRLRAHSIAGIELVQKLTLG